MQGFVFTLMALIALYVGFHALRGRRSQPTPQNHRPAPEPTISLKLHDENRRSAPYRFDGTAYPQYRIEYADADGVISNRDIFIDTWNTRGDIHYMRCWCFLRDEERQFRSDRILSAVNLSTNRKIKDIVAHLKRW